MTELTPQEAEVIRSFGYSTIGLDRAGVWLLIEGPYIRNVYVRPPEDGRVPEYEARLAYARGIKTLVGEKTTLATLNQDGVFLLLS